MRNHIAIKFIAVALAALALLTAVGSAVGIVCLTALDLYDQSVEQLREEQMADQRQEFAVNLAHRYASLHLGGLPEAYLNEYFGFQWYYDTFEYGCFFYTIRDEHGTVVETTVEQVMDGATHYETSVTDIRYRRVVHELPESSDITITEDPTDPVEDNTVPEETTEPVSTDAVSTDTTPEDPAEADTSREVARDTETEAAEAGAEDPASLDYGELDAAAAGQKSEEHTVFSEWYYDYEQEVYVEVRWEYVELPPYTVELYLLPGALADEYLWTLLQMIWEIRDYLFFALGAGLLVLAISMVYLCCAAGRRPGQTEVRASGLNRIPLDLYLCTVATLVFAAVMICVRSGAYLLEGSTQILIPFVSMMGYGCALLIVGFLFALAAQLKTPGGFWWRGSVIGRCLRLAWLLAGKCLALCRWMLRHLPQWLKKTVLGIFGMLGACFRWIGGRIARLYGLLPLVWQWLLAGFVLFLLLVLTICSDDAGTILLGLLLSLGIILYGAHAFGTLMEGTKRMGKGDLDSKVDDTLLVGSFKEFAGDLNALSEVAVVAAQNQMKAERMKTELITNVSHDIKTPLTSIINFVDLMEKPHTPQEQEQYLEVLSRQSHRLKKLIDDLMEMSKVSTGNLAVEITQVDAAEAINQALGEFADKLERAELTPVFRAPENSVTMRADGRLAWRVMSNLLSNAVKYAMPGTRLYIDLSELDGKVVISLKNISRDSLNVSAEELLERFVRGDSSRNTEGSGLGLNIAKSLMELQKGQLRLLVDGDLFKVTLLFPKG